MLAYIKGILAEKNKNYVVIDVGGLGYKIFMAETAIEKIGEIDNNVKVFTHYHVREDDISIYGFLSNEELRMFELLISVSGVGAKSAISMLSNIEPSSFAIAVISNDTTEIVKIPGIGAKTAARIILELKDKLKKEEGFTEAKISVKEKNQNIETISEAISALQVLGYQKKDIEKAFEKIDKEGSSVEDLIKKGLNQLSK